MDVVGSMQADMLLEKELRVLIVPHPMNLGTIFIQTAT